MRIVRNQVMICYTMVKRGSGFDNPGGRGRSGFALRGASRSEVKGFDVVGAEPVVYGLQGGTGKLLGEEDGQTLLRP